MPIYRCKKCGSKDVELDNSSILVCEECGNENIQIKAWIYANTNEYAGEMENLGMCWCDCCDEHTHITNKDIYLAHKRENDYKDEDD